MRKPSNTVSENTGKVKRKCEERDDFYLIPKTGTAAYVMLMMKEDDKRIQMLSGAKGKQD